MGLLRISETLENAEKGGWLGSCSPGPGTGEPLGANKELWRAHKLMISLENKYSETPKGQEY